MRTLTLRFDSQVAADAALDAVWEHIDGEAMVRPSGAEWLLELVAEQSVTEEQLRGWCRDAAGSRTEPAAAAEPSEHQEAGAPTMLAEETGKAGDPIAAPASAGAEKAADGPSDHAGNEPEGRPEAVPAVEQPDGATGGVPGPAVEQAAEPKARKRKRKPAARAQAPASSGERRDAPAAATLPEQPPRAEVPVAPDGKNSALPTRPDNSSPKRPARRPRAAQYQHSLFDLGA